MDGHIDCISFATCCFQLVCQQVLEHHRVRGIAVLTNQVALRVIHVVRAGQDELGDTTGHKVTDEWFESSGQLLPVGTRPELQSTINLFTSRRKGELLLLNGTRTAIVGLQLDSNLSLLGGLLLTSAV